MATGKDLRKEVKALRDYISKNLKGKPDKDKKQSALQDAWVAHLEPRIGRVYNKVKALMTVKRWVRKGTKGVALKPAHWNHVIRQLVSDAYVDLAGSLRGYFNVRPTWRAKIRFGIFKGKNAAIGSAKQIAAQRKAAKEAAEKLKAARNESYAATMKLVLDGLEAKRTHMEEAISRLQSIVDALMEVEEARLRELLSDAPEETQEKGALIIEEMEEHRIEARDFALDGGRGAADYSRLLGWWNGARREAAAELA